MSQLITNPYDDADAGHGHGLEPNQPDHDGPGQGPVPDAFAQPPIVVSYDAAVGPSGDQDHDGDGESDGGSARAGLPARARAVMAAVSNAAIAAGGTALRTAYRYPRWAAVVALSVTVLGAIALTRPGRATPHAAIPAQQASNSDDKSDANEDDKANKTDKTDKADSTEVAQNDASGDGARKPEDEAGKPATGPKANDDHPATPSTTASADGDGKDQPKPAGEGNAGASETTTVAQAGPTGTEAHEPGKEAGSPSTPPSGEPSKTVAAPPPLLTANAQAGGAAPGGQASEPATVPGPPALPSSEPKNDAPAPTTPPPALTSVGEPPPLANQKPGSEAPAGSPTAPKPTETDTLPPLPGPGSELTLTGATDAANRKPGDNKPGPNAGAGAKNPAEPPAGLGALPATPSGGVTEAKPAATPPGGGPEKPLGPMPAPEAGGLPLVGNAPPISPPATTTPPPTAAAPVEVAAVAPKAAAAKEEPKPSDPKASPEPKKVEPPAAAANGSSAPAPTPAPIPGPVPIGSTPAGESGPPQLDGPPATPAPGGLTAPLPLPRVDPATPPPAAAPAVGAAPESAKQGALPPVGAPPAAAPEHSEPAKPAPGAAPAPEPPANVGGHENRPAEPAPGASLMPKDEPGTNLKPNDEPTPPAVGGPGHTDGSPGAGHGPAGAPAQPAALPTTVEPGALGRPSASTDGAGREEPAAPPAEPATTRIPAGIESAGALGGAGATTTAASPVASSTAAIPAGPPTGEGWVPIPNKGHLPSDLAADDRPASIAAGPSPRLAGRIVESTPETVGAVETAAAGTASPRPAIDRRAAASQRGTASPKAARVEPALHTVTRGENFWTISRLYYGSGRYYKALWKANSQQYPDINDLHIDDVILIPAPEDLDPALIVQPSRSTAAGRVRGRSPSSGDLARTNPPTAARRARTAAPAETSNPGRPGQAEPELDLPISVGDEETNPGHDDAPAPGRSPGRLDDGGDALPTSATAARLTARPRPSSSLTTRPVYKVRRYDTLRSIARDVLGDPHRADELYELNRDAISDPSRLAVGQLLDLPDDADTRRLSARDRSSGLD